MGAGGPSVASWLAARTGPIGYVLATDIDITWMRLSGRPISTSAVTTLPVRRRLQGCSTSPTPGSVLTHVRDRDIAIDNMVSALAPGGWLLIEDFDVSIQPRAVLDTERDDLVANRIRAGFESLLAERGVDLEFGRKLPRLLRERGLLDVGADAYMPVAMPPVAALEEANVHQVRDALVARRLATDPEIQCHLKSLRSGDVDIATPPLVSAWGRRA